MPNFYQRGVAKMRQLFGHGADAVSDAGTGLMPYDPIYAAQQAAKAGLPSAARSGDIAPLSRWDKFMQASAPARAGLAVGVPVGGLMGAAVYNDPTLPKDEKALAAGVTGLTSALAFGVPAAHARHALQPAIRGVRDQMHNIHMSGQPPASAVSEAVEEMLRHSPDMPIRGGTRNKFTREPELFEGTLRDVQDIMRNKHTGFLSGLGLSSAKDQAALEAKENIFKAMREGAMGNAGPKQSAGARLLEELKQREPGLSQKELMRRLHPDRVGRNPDIDVDAAGDAFAQLSRGLSPAKDYMAPARASGATAHARRADAIRSLDKGLASMFPRVKKLNEGLKGSL